MQTPFYEGKQDKKHQMKNANQIQAGERTQWGHPATHLTRTETGWTLIHNGMPLCRENSTFGDAVATGARYRLHIPEQVWIAQLGRFGSLAEAKAS